MCRVAADMYRVMWRRLILDWSMYSSQDGYIHWPYLAVFTLRRPGLNHTACTGDDLTIQLRLHFARVQGRWVPMPQCRYDWLTTDGCGRVEELVDGWRPDPRVPESYMYESLRQALADKVNGYEHPNIHKLRGVPTPFFYQAMEAYQQTPYGRLHLTYNLQCDTPPHGGSDSDK